jgi:MacB-like protein
MFGQDIRFGLRILTKSPGFTLIVVLALALGIGANTMVFAIYNGALLKSLPFENPRQVVVIRNRNLTEGYQFNLSYPDYLTYRDELRSFSSIAANVNNAFVLSDDSNAAESLSGNRITPNTFALGLRHLLIGLPPGVAAAFGLSRLLEGQLYQVTSTDLLTFVSTSVFMFAVVILACLIPATRASRLNAMDAFRME